MVTILKKFSATTAKICRNLNLCIDPKRNYKTHFPINHVLNMPGPKSQIPHTDGGEGSKQNIISIVQLADIHIDPQYAIVSWCNMK